MSETINNLTGEVVEVEPLKIEIKNEKSFLKEISFNYENLKKEIESFTEKYDNLVYSDYKIIEAKRDRAYLNKSIKYLEDERKKVKKEINKPYVEFETKVKELISLIEKPSIEIDNQVKKYEDSQKQERLEKAKSLYNTSTLSNIFDFDDIKIKEIELLSIKFEKAQIIFNEFLERVDKDYNTLKALKFDLTKSVKLFKENGFDLSQTLFYLEKEKREEEEIKEKIEKKEKKEEEIKEKQKFYLKPETKEYRIVLEIFGDTEKLKELRAFMNLNNIKFNTLEKGEK